MDDLNSHTAEQVIDLLRRRQVSPTELVKASIRRIEATDTQLNAIPTRCFERALEQAARLEGQRSHGMTGAAFLHGLPIAVKDNLDVAGVRTTHGSLVFKDRVPSTSDVVVSRLEANGAIVMGKSNIPEFSCGGHTFNDVFGTTYNPWDTQVTAGGSSGGSAAALAAGQVWLATGNDFAGSIRIPASYCSVVGFRPSPGMVPRVQPQPFVSLSIEGTMARTVSDAAIMFDAEVGWHPVDPLTHRADHASYYQSSKAPRMPQRVAVSPDLGLASVDDRLSQVCLDAGKQLERAGAHVELACPDLMDAVKGFEILRGAIYVGRVGALLDQHRHLLKPEVVENAEYGLSLTVADIVAAEKIQGEVIRRTAEFFERYDLLICPVTISPPFSSSWRYLKDYKGVSFENHLQPLVLTYALSMTCCPTMSIPGGFTDTGLPIGLQLVGPPRGEHDLFSAAAFIESMLDICPVMPKITSAS